MTAGHRDDTSMLSDWNRWAADFNSDEKWRRNATDALPRKWKRSLCRRSALVRYIMTSDTASTCTHVDYIKSYTVTQKHSLKLPLCLLILRGTQSTDKSHHITRSWAFSPFLSRSASTFPSLSSAFPSCLEVPEKSTLKTGTTDAATGLSQFISTHTPKKHSCLWLSSCGEN